MGSEMCIRDRGHKGPYEVIPNRWIARVLNRGDFVGALLLDLWTNHCDRRQCVFVSTGTTSSLRAVLIDNDHMFGGFAGNEKTCPRRTMLPNEGFYGGVWTNANVAQWKRVIDSIDDRTIDQMFARVPDTWADFPGLRRAMTELGLRRARLDSLIAEVDDVLEDGRFLSVESPRCAELVD